MLNENFAVLQVAGHLPPWDADHAQGNAFVP